MNVISACVEMAAAFPYNMRSLTNECSGIPRLYGLSIKPGSAATKMWPKFRSAILPLFLTSVVPRSNLTYLDIQHERYCYIDLTRLITMSSLYPCGKPCSTETHENRWSTNIKSNGTGGKETHLDIRLQTDTLIWAWPCPIIVLSSNLRELPIKRLCTW